MAPRHLAWPAAGEPLAWLMAHNGAVIRKFQPALLRAPINRLGLDVGLGENGGSPGAGRNA